MVWVALGLIHLGIPLAYFARMRRVTRTLNGYRLNLNEGYRPTVTILIPTYNEASVIRKKVENLARVDYPKDKVDLVVVDGGSKDGTPELAHTALEQSGLRGIVIREGGRKGKAAGLNRGLEVATGELVCISDAECDWHQDALRNAVKYFSDPSIGSVSGIHNIQNSQETMSTRVEDSYRSVYRLLRIAESKIHSTPVAEGELQLFRRTQLEGFDPTVGGDDTDAALVMVSKGLRAISAEDVIFFEPTPRSWGVRFRQKIRRGQHILQAFLKHKGLLFSSDSAFSRTIFPVEFFLYAVNPVLFGPFLAFTILALVDLPLLLLVVLPGLALVLSVPNLRRAWITYLSNNLTMMGAIFQEARGVKQLQWTKIEETREPARATHIPGSTR